MQRDYSPTQLLTSHSLSMCCMKGCLGRSAWAPTISITANKITYAYLNMKHWVVCDYHKQELSLEDMISGPTGSGIDAWDRVRSAFISTGKEPPIKEFSRLIWRPA